MYDAATLSVERSERHQGRLLTALALHLATVCLRPVAQSAGWGSDRAAAKASSRCGADRMIGAGTGHEVSTGPEPKGLSGASLLYDAITHHRPVGHEQDRQRHRQSGHRRWQSRSAERPDTLTKSWPISVSNEMTARPVAGPRVPCGRMPVAA